MDDIVVHSRNMTEDDERLQKIMEWLETAGLKLNTGKCVLRKGELHFLDQVINKDGMQPDSDKALSTQRALGMFTYLGKYISDPSPCMNC